MSSFVYPVASLQQSADGRLLTVCAGTHVRVIDVQQRRVLACTSSLGTAGEKPGALARSACAVAFDADQVRVAVACDDKFLHCYSLRSGGALEHVGSRGFHRRLTSCAFVSTHSVAVADKFGDGYLVAWDSPALGKVPSVPMQGEFSADFGSLSTITAMLPLPAALGRLACANRDAQVFVVRVPDVFEISAFCLGHEALVTSLAHTTPSVGGGTPILLSAGGDGSVRAWNAVSGAALADLQLRADHKPLDIITGVEDLLPATQVVRALSAFDVNVYFVTQDGCVRHVALEEDGSGAVRFSASQRVIVDKNATCVAASPEGVWVAFDDGRVELRATADGATLAAVDGVALPAESANARELALSEIDPMQLVHRFNQRSNEAQNAGERNNESDDE